MALPHNPILQDPNGLVLNPKVLREHPPQQGRFLIPLHPRFMIERIARAECVHGNAPLPAAAAVGHAVHVIGRECRFIVVVKGVEGSAVAELFPRSEIPVMPGMNDDAEAFVSGHPDAETDEEQRETQQPPPP